MSDCILWLYFLSILSNLLTKIHPLISARNSPGLLILTGWASKNDVQWGCIQIHPLRTARNLPGLLILTGWPSQNNVQWGCIQSSIIQEINVSGLKVKQKIKKYSILKTIDNINQFIIFNILNISETINTKFNTYFLLQNNLCEFTA